LTAHLRMMYGDFIQAPGADGLNTSDKTLYWIHALVFMLVTFILLRFTFLAVIIDAFCDVRGEKSAVAYDTLFDVADACLVRRHFNQSGWPSQQQLAEWLSESTSESDMNVTPQRFSEAFRDPEQYPPDIEGSTRLATEILEYYMRKVPAVVSSGVAKPHAEDAQSGQQSLRDAAAAPDHAAAPAAPAAPQRKLDGKRLAQQVVHEVTYRLAERRPEEIDRFVTIGLLSCTIAREFRKCGLIKPENLEL